MSVGPGRRESAWILAMISPPDPGGFGMRKPEVVGKPFDPPPAMYMLPAPSSRMQLAPSPPLPPRKVENAGEAPSAAKTVMNASLSPDIGTLDRIDGRKIRETECLRRRRRCREH